MSQRGHLLAWNICPSDWRDGTSWKNLAIIREYNVEAVNSGFTKTNWWDIVYLCVHFIKLPQSWRHMAELSFYQWSKLQIRFRIAYIEFTHWALVSLTSQHITIDWPIHIKGPWKLQFYSRFNILVLLLWRNHAHQITLVRVDEPGVPNRWP